MRNFKSGGLAREAGPAAAASFEQVARRWLVEYPALNQIRPATLSNYRSFVEGHLIPYFDQRPITDLTASAIEGFIAAKRAPGGSARFNDRPLADRAIHAGLVALRLILKRAARDKLLPANPMTDVEWRGSARPDRIDPFDSQELRQILAAACQVEPGFAVMLQVWARAGEICGLRWEDLDLARGLVAASVGTYQNRPGENRILSAPHPNGCGRLEARRIERIGGDRSTGPTVPGRWGRTLRLWACRPAAPIRSTSSALAASGHAGRRPIPGTRATSTWPGEHASLAERAAGLCAEAGGLAVGQRPSAVICRVASRG
jgi:hypothetical protein